MVENRPDWCISRQRYWGIPIPAFRCKTCHTAHLTGVFNAAVVALVKKAGSTGWFSHTPEEILPSGTACTQCGGHVFEKENDILDVWFESGASFAGALLTRGESVPADLYLEGSDQHRGWFQSSLLIASAAMGHAPYKAVLTHGFLVDEAGKKMSKSMGNVVDPAAVIAQSGADILRWWVASTDFKGDLSISQNIIKQATDSFSKVRNTIRFLLSNLYDFDDATDLVPVDRLESVDRWMLAELANLADKVVADYAQYNIHTIAHQIHPFCSVTLSSTYLDIVKDRLYCDAAAGQKRRSTQTVLFHMLDTLLPLLAPILVFTSEDAYQHWNPLGKLASIHLKPIAPSPTEWRNPTVVETWQQILACRESVYQVLEPMRADKTLKSFLDAKVTLTVPAPLASLDWASILIVSQVDVKTGNTLTIHAEKADGDKCERCWKTLNLRRNLCSRCEAVVYPS
jgi:isoleucyl-tRNA synthetase